MNFSQAPSSVQEILRVIAQVPSGRQALERFLPLFDSRKVTIESYSPELVAKMRELIGPDQPIGACFMNDGETGTIYVDMTSPLGILAPFLLHEIIHSLDETVWKAAGARLTSKRKDAIFLRAEVKAFETQAVFMREMKEKHAEYRAFIATQYPRARILHDRLTQDELVDLYGFKVS